MTRRRDTLSARIVAGFVSAQVHADASVRQDGRSSLEFARMVLSNVLGPQAVDPALWHGSPWGPITAVLRHWTEFEAEGPAPAAPGWYLVQRWWGRDTEPPGSIGSFTLGFLWCPQPGSTPLVGAAVERSGWQARPWDEYTGPLATLRWVRLGDV